MSGTEIRPAGPGDAAAISAVGSAAFHAAYDGTGEPEGIDRHVETNFGEQAVTDELGNPDVAYLAAFEGPNCLGFLKLRESPRPDLVAAARPLEVQQLYVDPAAQRRGVGARLMDAAVERARVQGSDALWLSVWTEADWATSFYRRAGFTALGRIPFLLDTAEYVDLLMWRPIDGR